MSNARFGVNMIWYFVGQWRATEPAFFGFSMTYMTRPVIVALGVHNRDLSKDSSEPHDPGKHDNRLNSILLSLSRALRFLCFGFGLGNTAESSCLHGKILATSDASYYCIIPVCFSASRFPPLIRIAVVRLVQTATASGCLFSVRRLSIQSPGITRGSPGILGIRLPLTLL